MLIILNIACYFSDEPTSFWITNPLTYVRNNVAAGGEVSWFLYTKYILFLTVLI